MDSYKLFSYLNKWVYEVRSRKEREREEEKELAGISSLLPPDESQRSNSGCQAWQSLSFPTEPSRQASIWGFKMWSL